MRALNPTALARLAAATLLVTLLASCSREAQPLPPEAAPAITPAPDATPGPAATPPDSAPPTDPSATAKPTSAQIPDLDSMLVAKTSGKLGVAADVRYSFESAATPNQPVTLNIAVVPRVAGQILEFSLQPTDGVQIAAGPVTRLKVNQADTLRQQYSISRTSGTPRTLRVLVTHQWDGGSAFGFYSIPFD